MGTGAAPATAGPVAQPPRLLDQVRDTARRHGHSEPAASAIADWCERFSRFHRKRHPRELGIDEVARFLDCLAQTDKEPVRSLVASRQALERS